MLAGGRSSRFGRDKLAVPYLGMPLLHHAIIRLIEVCDGVVVVLAPDAEEPALPPGIDVRIARDATEGEGPLAGLVAGLTVTATEWAVVVGGDMPDVSAAVVVEMLRVAVESSADAVALADDGARRSLPLVVRSGAARSAAHALLHQEPRHQEPRHQEPRHQEPRHVLGRERRRSLRTLLDGLRVAIIDEPTWHALDPRLGSLRDVDVPADLDR